MFGNVAARLSQLLTQDVTNTSIKIGHIGTTIASAMQTSMGALNPQDRQRIVALAYITILNNAIKKASDQTSFNLETAINDLWTKFDGIRTLDRTGDSSPLARFLSAERELIETIGEALKDK